MVSDTDLLDWLEDVGNGVALVHDDNDSWAVAFAGVHNVRMAPGEGLETTYWVEPEAFRDSVRGAILYAMENEENG